MKPVITYIKVGGSYQLIDDYRVMTSIRPLVAIVTPRLELSITGLLIIRAGYCWDGCSGIVDRKTNMRAGLGHDGLYELLRRGELPYGWWPKADAHFDEVLIQDGSWKITAKIDMIGLRIANGRYAHPSRRKKRHHAP